MSSRKKQRNLKLAQSYNNYQEQSAPVHEIFGQPADVYYAERDIYYAEQREFYKSAKCSAYISLMFFGLIAIYAVLIIEQVMHIDICSSHTLHMMYMICIPIQIVLLLISGKLFALLTHCINIITACCMLYNNYVTYKVFIEAVDLSITNPNLIFANHCLLTLLLVILTCIFLALPIAMSFAAAEIIRSDFE